MVRPHLLPPRRRRYADPEVMRYLGRPPSREVLRDKIIPFFLDAYQRHDRLGTCLILVRTTACQGPDADVIGGAEHGEVDYALTKPEWQASAAGGR